MSPDSDAIRSAAADAAAAPLDLLTDAATGVLRRVNRGSGLRLAAALAGHGLLPGAGAGW
jgi:hypothetical protein